MFLNLYFQSIYPFRAIIKSNFKKVNKLKYPFFFTQNKTTMLRPNVFPKPLCNCEKQPTSGVSILSNFAKFTETYLFQSFFFNKVAQFKHWESQKNLFFSTLDAAQNTEFFSEGFFSRCDHICNNLITFSEETFTGKLHFLPIVVSFL